MNITANLGASDSVLAIALAQLPEIMLVVARDGTINVANRHARTLLHKMSGLTVEDRCQISDVFDKSSAELIHDISIGATTGTVTLPLRSKPEMQLSKLRFKVEPLCHETRRRPDSFLLMHRETSKIDSTFSRLNVELRATNSAAARAREESMLLKSTVEELEQFSVIAAHDLKAPLRNISMLLQFIDEDHGDALPEEAREMMRLADASAERLTALISRLLGFAKAGKSTIATEAVLLKQTIDDVQENLAQQIAAANAAVVIEGDLGKIDADPSLLNQLLENLIGNAIKYRAPDRGPLIKLQRYPREGGGSFIELHDNGRGFDNNMAEQMFEPFKRLHVDSNVEGSGVGLATCRRICERFGWRLTAEGEEGVGATFRIFLPV